MVIISEQVLLNELSILKFLYDMMIIQEKKGNAIILGMYHNNI